MSGNLRQALIRIVLTFGVLMVLGIWQFGFVIQAIQANIMLNGTIIGTFAFGCFLTFRNVIRLKNEELAFAAPGC